MSNRRRCTIEGCDLTHHALDLCRRHYNRKRRHGSPHIVKGNYTAPKLDRKCSLWGCDRPHHARGFCHPHYEKSRRPEPEPRPTSGVAGRVKCEECSDEPMGGGRWCLTHFQAYVTQQDLERPARRKQSRPHGTEGARAGHRRRGEPLCPECRESVDNWIERMTRVA